MAYEHKPVLTEQTIELLQPENCRVIVDGTMGGAGHSKQLLSRMPESGQLIAIDQDPEAFQVGKERLSAYRNVRIINDNFANIAHICKKLDIVYIDGLLLDLGVSSYQLDMGTRGFSYQQDTFLDMRMNINQSLTAAQVVNSLTTEELAKIIKTYGEEKWARRIAQFIVSFRQEKPIKFTGELVDIIKAAIPKNARKDGPHPAKRTFQALRIYVNSELEVLERTIDEAINLLRTGGRMAIITFHSLEDRIVKHKFKALAKSCHCPPELPICQCEGSAKVKILTKKPITPNEEELTENHRARSAKLRCVERLSSN